MNSQPPVNNLSKVVNPNMVILARESRGLSQKMLADELGVTQGRVSKIEMGLLPVPNELLEELSHVLDYPMHFFLQEGSIIGVGIAEVFHRKRKDVPKKVLDKIYAQMEIRFKHVDALLRATDFDCTVPRISVDEYSVQVEDIARLVRATWHLPRGPIQDLTQVVEDAGVLIVEFDFETPRVDAISRWMPACPPVFFVNKGCPKDRYRYSLAHELGHMVMHHLPHSNIEEQADRFAAEFLLPERDIYADLRDLSLARLAVLKQYWKVSMAAILMRARTLDVISESRYRYLWTQMANAGYKTREPAELDVIGEQPSLLNEIIETYLKELGYTTEDLARILPLNDRELWSQYLQGQGQPLFRIIHGSGS
jgi:Zn-dependent peptidase ImmA (M78 family)/DNA-binding XRE family transcriptional regulator